MFVRVVMHSSSMENDKENRYYRSVLKAIGRFDNVCNTSFNISEDIEGPR